MNGHPGKMAYTHTRVRLYDVSLFSLHDVDWHMISSIGVSKCVELGGRGGDRSTISQLAIAISAYVRPPVSLAQLQSLIMHTYVPHAGKRWCFILVRY